MTLSLAGPRRVGEGRGKIIENRRNHNACSFEARLPMANLGIYDELNRASNSGPS
jgi:hypothetical protein